MNTPFADLLAREQQRAFATAIVTRMAELDFLSESTASMGASDVAHLVTADSKIEVDDPQVVRRALASKVVDAAAAVTNAIRKSTPAVRTIIEFAAFTGEFVLQVTREATKKMGRPIHGPACPLCGSPTVLKRNRKTGTVFAACSSWDETGCVFTAGVTFDQG